MSRLHGSDLSGALSCATDAARLAGEVLRAEFLRPGGPRGTTHGAEVDGEVERLILERLTAAFPDDGFLGEELGPVRPPSAGTGRLWVVDPNDGTSAYLAGFRGAATSIALLVRGEPVLGVVHAFNYPDDRGDLIAWAKGGPILRNGQPVKRDWPKAPTAEGIVLVSQHADRNAPANAKLTAPMRYRAIPSIAYRLALAAVGEGDAAVSLNAPCVWDLAGGHAVLLAAGGDVYTEDGQSIRYAPDGACRTTANVFGGPKALVDHLRRQNWDQVFEPAAKSGPLSLCWPERGKAVADTGVLSRAQGCLLGQLAGDALGSLVEFQSPEQIKRAYPGGVRRLADGGVWGTIAGQPTDDSELALALARSQAQHGAFKKEAVLEAYRYWLESHPFDCGSTTYSGLHGRWNFESQANGALMRASPLGVFGANCDLNTVAEWARQDAALTHPHPVCQQASAIYVMAIAHAIRVGPTPEDLYRQIVVRADEMGAKDSLKEAVRGASEGPPPDYVSQQGWVFVAVRNALWQLLHADGVEQGVVDTVMRGGDTDTNAAICGALLGAVHGRPSVPSQWVSRLLTCRPIAGLPNVLQPRPECFWPVDALILAERLVARL